MVSPRERCARTALLLVFASTLASPLAGGCAQPKPEPQIASSATESSYAETWPEDLDARSAAFAGRQESARKIFSEFFLYPQKLEDGKAPWVAQIYARADAAGRSYGYVERMRKIEAAAGFFASEKGELGKRVGGAVAYQLEKGKEAKKCPCVVDVGGTVNATLEDAYGDRLEKRMRERNEAHRVIARYRDAMPKKDVGTLEDQADDIAYASFVVRVELVEQKLALRRMLAEAETIPKTIDAAVAEERAFQAQPARTDAEKKAAEGRIDALRRSRALAEQAATRAKALSERMDQQLTGLEKEYREAFELMLQKVSGK